MKQRTNKRVLIPERGRRSRGRSIQRGARRKRPPVLSVKSMENRKLPVSHPILLFQLSRPSRQWIVPPVSVPLYWLDRVMLNKRLIIAIPPDLFVAGGRRFRVIAQDYKIIGIGYTRWLCYEERHDFPDEGKP
jgi:hypothetical protein